MNGLGKLRTALTVVFAVTLAAIFAVLLYVLYSRRRFQRRSLGGGGADQFYTSYSKELLYFFCWKNQSRVEPDAAAPPPPLNGGGSAAQTEALDELEKWQRLYGPSRILFTIREEDREGLESDYSSSAEKGRKTRTVSMEDGFGAVVIGSAPEVAVRVDEDEATPFSTPCASPPYYTPSPSPSREISGGSFADNEEVAILVSLEVDGKLKSSR